MGASPSQCCGGGWQSASVSRRQVLEINACIAAQSAALGALEKPAGMSDIAALDELVTQLDEVRRRVALLERYVEPTTAAGAALGSARRRALRALGQTHLSRSSAFDGVLTMHGDRLRRGTAEELRSNRWASEAAAHSALGELYARGGSALSLAEIGADPAVRGRELQLLAPLLTLFCECSDDFARARLKRCEELRSRGCALVARAQSEQRAASSGPGAALKLGAKKPRDAAAVGTVDALLDALGRRLAALTTAVPIAAAHAAAHAAAIAARVAAVAATSSIARAKDVVKRRRARQAAKEVKRASASRSASAGAGGPPPLESSAPPREAGKENAENTVS